MRAVMSIDALPSATSVIRRSGRGFILGVLSFLGPFLFSTCGPPGRDAHHSVQSHEDARVAVRSDGFSDRVQFFAVAQPPKERRKVSRVTLSRPLVARIGNARVYVIDASVEGLRIAHQGGVPQPGQAVHVAFDWEGQSIEVDGDVTSNNLHKLAKSAEEKSTYHAGLRITKAIGESAAALRQMIADIVARALDEQKANARGIPASAAQVVQTGKGTDFLRCELVEGIWRRTSTSRPDQPSSGFTVSAAEAPEEIDMLCEAYASADAAGKKLIQTMAEMSISKTEGVPTRRYNP